MRRKSLKLVIFDCDGTLVDSQHMIVGAMTKAYEAQGLPLPEREILLSVVGLSLVEAFTKLGQGQGQFPAESLANHYRDAFQAMRAPGLPVEPLYPGAAEAIAELGQRGDVVLGVATGKSQRGVRLVLGYHGLLEHFTSRPQMTRRRSRTPKWSLRRCRRRAPNRRTRSWSAIRSMTWRWR